MQRGSDQYIHSYRKTYSDVIMESLLLYMIFRFYSYLVLLLVFVFAFFNICPLNPLNMYLSTLSLSLYIYIYAQRLGFAQALQRRGFPFTNK